MWNEQILYGEWYTQHFGKSITDRFFPPMCIISEFTYIFIPY